MKIIVTDNLTGLVTEEEFNDSQSINTPAIGVKLTVEERLTSVEATQDEVVTVLATALGVTI